MDDLITDWTVFAAIVAAFFIFVYWLGGKLIDMILPADEIQAQRDVEDMLKQADKELKRRDRLIKKNKFLNKY